MALTSINFFSPTGLVGKKNGTHLDFEELVRGGVGVGVLPDAGDGDGSLDLVPDVFSRPGVLLVEEQRRFHPEGATDPGSPLLQL